MQYLLTYLHHAILDGSILGWEIFTDVATPCGPGSQHIGTGNIYKRDYTYTVRSWIVAYWDMQYLQT